jgi:hypothetical protein
MGHHLSLLAIDFSPIILPTKLCVVYAFASEL